MDALRVYYAQLRLRVNEDKSAVARVWDRKFLAYSFWVAKGRAVKLRVAPKALEGFKERVLAGHEPERRAEPGTGLRGAGQLSTRLAAVLRAGRDAQSSPDLGPMDSPPAAKLSSVTRPWRFRASTALKPALSLA